MNVAPGIITTSIDIGPFTDSFTEPITPLRSFTLAVKEYSKLPEFEGTIITTLNKLPSKLATLPSSFQLSLTTATSPMLNPPFNDKTDELAEP